MSQPLGAAGGDLRIVSEGQTYFLPLIQSGSRDVPAGTTTERAYVNPRRNPPRARTSPGGPGEYSFTYDKNASAAIQALRRANRTQEVLAVDWISNDVDQVVKGAAGTSLVAIAAASGGNPPVATFSGTSPVDLTGAEIDSAQFLCVGGAADDYDVCYVIDRILTARTCHVHRVGAVAGAKGEQTVTPDAAYTAPTVFPAAAFWQIVVPAEASGFQATVSQIDGSAIEQEAQEDTVVLSLSADAVEKYWIDEALNPPVDA